HGSLEEHNHRESHGEGAQWQRTGLARVRPEQPGSFFRGATHAGGFSLYLRGGCEYTSTKQHAELLSRCYLHGSTNFVTYTLAFPLKHRSADSLSPGALPFVVGLGTMFVAAHVSGVSAVFPSIISQLRV